MKRLLFFILTVGSLFTASDLPAARPVVGFLTNGEGNRIDWAARLPEYDVAEAGEGQFLLSQQHWDLDRRLLNRQPAACILHAGLPEILLGQPLPRILDAFRSVCMRLDTTGIRPVLLLTTPVSAAHPVVNARIRQLNDAPAIVGCRAGNRLPRTPRSGSARTVRSTPACTSDGMMLNAAGQEFLVAEVRDFPPDDGRRRRGTSRQQPVRNSPAKLPAASWRHRPGECADRPAGRLPDGQRRGLESPSRTPRCPQCRAGRFSDRGRWAGCWTPACWRPGPHSASCWAASTTCSTTSRRR